MKHERNVSITRETFLIIYFRGYHNRHLLLHFQPWPIFSHTYNVGIHFYVLFISQNNSYCVHIKNIKER